MERSRMSWCLLAGLLGPLGAAAAAPPEAPAGRIDAGRPPPIPRAVEFNRDIRPILSDKCFACHGPDAGKREADLRLDRREGLFTDREGATPVVPADTARSELLRRITTDDPADRMPPPETGKAVTEVEAALIRKWIEEGAAWQGHWAYIPPARPEPPPLERPGFVRNEIDRFILEKLGEKGLEPSPEADRSTLIRRLSFDLTGLPPTPERVAAFAGDPAEGAYEALVDELLASPHHGERMAMWWLDLVRYADSVGYHGDQPQTVWPYRDYVIDAFNRNKPFDRFTLEQIAGDLLSGATLEQKIAASYNRLNMMSAEGGGQDKEYHAKYASDRVRATSGAWLGATLGCAECHDHKFDPYTTRDFYGFAAFFADVAEKGIYHGSNDHGVWGEMLAVPSESQSAELARIDAELAKARGVLETPTPELAAAQSGWEASRSARRWTVLRAETASSAAGATLTVLEDGSILAGGTNPEKDTYTVAAGSPVRGITAFRVEALPHDSLPKKGSGRAQNGNFVLTELEVKREAQEAREAREVRKGTKADRAAAAVPLASASATFEQKAGGEKTPHGRWSAESAIDGDAKGDSFGWAVLEEAAKPQNAVFETREDLDPGEGGKLTFILEQNHGAGGHAIGRFRLSVTSSPRPVRAEPVLPEKIEEALEVPAAARSDAQTAELAAYFRSIAPALDPARARVAELEKARADLEKSIPRMPATVSMAPRTMRVLPRGNWMDDSGAVVDPAVPAFLPQPRIEGRKANRIDLARWLASPENPLTARVLVNRLWKLYFGAGLSRRLDDLGSQGDWPSHPRLLDWLAVELVEGGWDVKYLVKTIVLSGTYRQSSLFPAALREKDPYNRWLARQDRFRFDAELVRDNALAVSGLLSRRVGGPSVKPYQPRGYWSYLNFPVREWQNDAGEAQYRRGLYTHWQRQYLHPSLLAFDAPTREECTAERTRSNTPLQALVLLNDPTYVEASRAFAERIIEEGGADVEARLDWAFRAALSRRIEPGEAAVLAELHEKHLKEYKDEAGAAKDLLSAGLHPMPDGVDAAELAAWTSVARTILNLHETITRS